MKNRVSAGVGNPIKLFVCLLSTLNFANLNMAKNGINKAKNGSANN